jgi:hypothetical protein
MTTKSTSKDKKPESPKPLTVKPAVKIPLDKTGPTTKRTATVKAIIKTTPAAKAAVKKPIATKPKVKTPVVVDRTPPPNLKRIMTEGTKAMAATVTSEPK